MRQDKLKEDKHVSKLMEKDIRARQSLSRIKNKMMIISGKGGVGKTTVSVNLAIALVSLGYRVGLMDADVHGPDIPRMLGLKEMLGGADTGMLDPLYYSKNLAVISIESLMPDPDDAVIWRGSLKHSAIRQFIGDVEWGDLDFLLIDSPPGTGDEPLTVAQLIKDARVIIVTTPQEIALADIRKSISFCKRMNLNIFGLIENMSGLICPDCGKMIYVFGSGGGEHTARAAAISFLGRIPFDPNMVICGDLGISYQDQYTDSPITRIYSEIAENIARQFM